MNNDLRIFSAAQNWNEEFMPAGTVRTITLGDNDWLKVENVNGFGDQAFFDYYADGDETKGVRVTIARGTLKGVAGNGIPVLIDEGAALALAWDDAMGLTGDVAAASTLAQFKAAVDALANTPLTTAYFGTNNGAETVAGAAEQSFARGTFDRVIFVEARTGDREEAHVHVGNAEPAQAAAEWTVISGGGGHWRRALPAGGEVWVQRKTKAQICVTVEWWPIHNHD